MKEIKLKQQDLATITFKGTRKLDKLIEEEVLKDTDAFAEDMREKLLLVANVILFKHTTRNDIAASRVSMAIEHYFGKLGVEVFGIMEAVDISAKLSGVGKD